MKLDDSIKARTRGLVYAAFDVLWYSDAITNEINGYIHGHVQVPLRDMGFDWRAPWSERGEHAYLKETWGKNDEA